MIKEIEIKRIVLMHQIMDFELFIRKHNPSIVLELDKGLPNVKSAAEMNDEFKKWLDKYPVQDDADYKRVNMLNSIRQKKFQNIIRA
jgi:hypothetical protein